VFRGLVDEAEAVPVRLDVEQPDRDVLEDAPGQGVRPAGEALLGLLDRGGLVLARAGEPDLRAGMSAVGVESVQHRIPTVCDAASPACPRWLP
jgi:hypothetical protein